MNRIRLLLPGILAGALTLGACESQNAFGGPEAGRLTIQLTDAPGDLEEVFVKVERFILFRSEHDTMSASGKVELEPLTDDYIELLELTDGRLLNVVDEAVVPAGTYSQLRVVLDEAFVRLKDGRVFATPGAVLPAGVTANGELKCPSCSQSGFKVKFTNGGLVVDDNSIVLIDFDAAKSFGHEAGNSGKWIMHPVLRATAQTVALGRITGTVALDSGIAIPACGGQPNNVTAFMPSAAAATDTIVGTTDSTGVYRIMNVTPATYTLGFLKDITFTNGDSLTITAAATPPAVVVAAGDTAHSNYVISAATCH